MIQLKYLELFYTYVFLNVLGNDCVEYIETVCTADVKNLNIGGSTLTVFTNKNGGILDDLIITKCCEDQLYLVSNAARKQHDMQHLQNALVSLHY